MYIPTIILLHWIIILSLSGEIYCVIVVTTSVHVHWIVIVEAETGDRLDNHLSTEEVGNLMHNNVPTAESASMPNGSPQVPASHYTNWITCSAVSYKN